ncbi:MAG TPA: NAD(P)H-dependent oxidoreductase [Bosea sp. (in: a-proteobacteria)]|jgi:NAD(P)H-dependent FMN reductase|uniref:NADPH-dependent FMN reductase n=1 Tax=Bosea sp. (in: a-proteobacteria) TaxID=1871050 RepID=UPI002E0DF983|nr:NAD(P)H-dependent oxidoreductase [Bosea sp. (in: a-proteobacteria)]
MPKILVFAGSWRPGSMNTRLATLVAKKLAAAGAEVTQISLGDYPLPLIDARAFDNDPPAEAKALAALVEAHDGLFVISPEYNAGYPPALKNALDWISIVRSGGPGLRGKVVALGGASAGSLGTYRCLTQLRTVLELGFGALLVPEMLAVAGADKAYGEDGELSDRRTAGFLDKVVARLIKVAAMHP